jgi:N-acetylmuramoyl-L-alanine amidase
MVPSPPTTESNTREPAIAVAALPYESRLEARPLAQVDLVVLHCTELPDLATARSYGEQVHYDASGTGNSGHFYIDRDGGVHQWIDVGRTAHHTRGYNARSIGIELVNTGRYPHWLAAGHQAMDEPYTEAQIEALIALLQRLSDAMPSLQRIAGHEDLDTTDVEATDDPTQRVRRKRDPGPLFPWPRVMREIALERLQP